MALLKAAVAAEELHDLKRALETCKMLENKYSNGIMADQIFFNTARIYAEMKDMVNARSYYNKVITAFPESSFAQEAKKRLFMLGAK
jgi:outer membrane protein assembly factor BamD (BamD/ComL family)